MVAPADGAIDAQDLQPIRLYTADLVLVDPNNSNLVYVVWQEIDLPQGFGIRKSTPDFGAAGGNITSVFRRSTDGGRTWGADRRVTRSEGDCIKPSLALTRGFLHLIYLDTRDGRPRLCYRRAARPVHE